MALDVEAVLGAHRFDFRAVLIERDDNGTATGYTLACTCGDFRYSPGDDAQELMEAHVAAALRVEIDRALRYAWARGKFSEHTPACRLGDGDCICPNPYRPTLAATEGDRQ